MRQNLANLGTSKSNIEKYRNAIEKLTSAKKITGTYKEYIDFFCLV